MNKLIIKIAKKYDLLRSFRDKRATRLYSYFSKYLKKGQTIIDVGTGPGDLINILNLKGFKTTPVDVQDLSFLPNIKPIIYDGKNLPFKDKQFDVALLVTVLHHVKDPESLLEEVSRVAKHIIIVEEPYSSNFQKYATWIMDSVTNLEFCGHPHSNKTDTQWKNTFKKLNLDLKNTFYTKFWIFFTSATYVLDC